MWCEVLKIGGATPVRCDRSIGDNVAVCVTCRKTGLVPYPEKVPPCGCGRAGNHSEWCSYRKGVMENDREASAQERAYVDSRLAGAGKTEAMSLAGLSGTALAVEQRPAVQKYMHQVFSEQGITDELIAQKVKDGFSAMTVVKRRKEGGEEELISVEDHTNRVRYLDLAVRVKGGIADKGTLNVQGNVTFVNNFSRNTPCPLVIEGRVVGEE